MKIRAKLIWNYSLLTIILLLIFSIIVIFSYIIYRHSDFKIRLHDRAMSTANILLNNNKINSSMLRVIDKSIITAMGDLKITIYGQNEKIVYTNSPPSPLDETIVKDSSKVDFLKSFTKGKKSISFTYNKNGRNYIVEASAVDNYGLNELRSLLQIIMWVLIFSLLFILGFGFYNAIWSLKPFKEIVKEVDGIDPSQLSKRISVHGNDEISQLGRTFNTLLDRIENAFETEKSFISNASHELRTPVTSVLGQIEVVLNKSRSEEEYKSLLKSVYDDTSQMAIIINGFLDLAEANLAENQITMNPVRIDELIYDIVDHFKKLKPYYNISVDFSTNLDTDTQLECIANERLLRLMLNNLIDNACKYSRDKKAKVMIDFKPNLVIVTISDHGIGIPHDDLANLFKPLYRGKNTSGIPGHGIGLAIVKRIADLHNATIDIKSQVNVGTTTTVALKI